LIFNVVLIPVGREQLRRHFKVADDALELNCAKTAITA
jgi:hypothetical protein